MLICFLRTSRLILHLKLFTDTVVSTLSKYVTIKKTWLHRIFLLCCDWQKKDIRNLSKNYKVLSIDNYFYLYLYSYHIFSILRLKFWIWNKSKLVKLE